MSTSHREAGQAMAVVGPIEGRVALVALGAAGILGAAVALGGPQVLAVVFALTVVGTIAVRPHLGAYLYLAVTPLIVGMPRGDLIPIVRPNEALLALILAALTVRALVALAHGKPFRLPWDRIDVALLLLATFGSIVPLLLRYGRGLPISFDDVLYAMVFWKYYLVYRVFRTTVSNPRQIALCLWVAMASAAFVALIAILQVLDLFGVPAFLAAHYDDPFAGSGDTTSGRGTSTIANSFGVADVMAMSLAMVLAWLPGASGRRPILLGAGTLFVAGGVVAGQFSGMIGLLVAVLTVSFMTGRLARGIAAIVPVGGMIAMLFWPVIAERLKGFDGPAGLPSSWVGRLDNLERFVLPELTSGLNWAIGVRPAARLPAPEPWRDWVFIESGYLWLIWTGGVPLLIAFLGFAWLAFKDLCRAVRMPVGPGGVAACAGAAGLATIVALMPLDPHLTMRGGADLFFALLAIGLVGDPPAPPRAPS
jgi:hypothetical protein